MPQWSWVAAEINAKDHKNRQTPFSGIASISGAEKNGIVKQKRKPLTARKRLGEVWNPTATQFVFDRVQKFYSPRSLIFCARLLPCESGSWVLPEMVGGLFCLMSGISPVEIITTCADFDQDPPTVPSVRFSCVRFLLKSWTRPSLSRLVLIWQNSFHPHRLWRTINSITRCHMTSRKVLSTFCHVHTFI